MLRGVVAGSACVVAIGVIVAARGTPAPAATGTGSGGRLEAPPTPTAATKTVTQTPQDVLSYWTDQRVADAVPATPPAEVETLSPQPKEPAGPVSATPARTYGPNGQREPPTETPETSAPKGADAGEAPKDKTTRPSMPSSGGEELSPSTGD